MIAKENIALNQLNPENWIVGHGQFLRNIALSRVNDYQLAEDLVQETFVSAWKTRDRFRGDCTERTYLVKILNNKIIDFYRSRARRPLINASKLENYDLSEFHDWIDTQADPRQDLNPDTCAEKNEFIDVLKAAVDRLPEKMGMVFRLSQLHNLPSEEVAKRLNISTTNLWVLLHRARKRLRREMGAEWEGVTFSN